MSQRGIQSVEVGGRLLLALAHEGRPMALKDLAQAADMSPPKAHPYLVSWGKPGLISQDPGSGRYGLGPLAMQLGLISLQQYDPIRLASARLPELSAATGQTVAIAVWGNRGPTIVRIEESPALVHINMRHGSVMSVRGTASGRLFAAHLPRATWAALDGEARPDDEFERELAEVRRLGSSHAVDAAVPGVSAVAAPVFEGGGGIVLGLTAIGPTASFDVSPAGEAGR
ncbi:MAG: IclR family transcriptional regulator, partial [Burkholderiales bacterium]|nr:IclR family transcriptional regulator [Burkholderiales bacterium]